MKILLIAMVLFCASMVGVAAAQEHWTEGSVWACSAYRTKDGQFDNYLEYLRGNYLPQMAESKKAGLVLDSKVFIQTPSDAKDWNIMICTLHSSYGKALDFNADDDAKQKEIAAKHFKTPDEEKQRELTSKRFDMREFVSNRFVREVTLRPLQ